MGTGSFPGPETNVIERQLKTKKNKTRTFSNFRRDYAAPAFTMFMAGEGNMIIPSYCQRSREIPTIPTPVHPVRTPVVRNRNGAHASKRGADDSPGFRRGPRLPLAVRKTGQTWGVLRTFYAVHNILFFYFFVIFFPDRDTYSGARSTGERTLFDVHEFYCNLLKLK